MTKNFTDQKRAATIISAKLLNEVQREKYDFTRTTLTALLREVLNNKHYRADYFVDEHGRELIEVSFDNEYSIYKFDVTADSLLSMTKDVLRRF